MNQRQLQKLKEEEQKALDEYEEKQRILREAIKEAKKCEQREKILNYKATLESLQTTQ